MRQSVTLPLALCIACAGHKASDSSVPAPAPATAGAITAGSDLSRPAAGETDSVRLAALHIPREVAGFRAVRRRDFDDPRDGSVLRFVGSRPLAADVYIYPIIPPSMATTDAGRDSAAMLEFRKAREEIYLFQTQSGRRAPQAVGEREVTAPAGGTRIARGRRGTFAYQRDSVRWTSHLYVFGLRDRYVKVRSSYDDREGPVEAPPALDRFVQALVTAIATGYEPEAKP